MKPNPLPQWSNTSFPNFSAPATRKSRLLRFSPNPWILVFSLLSVPLLSAESRSIHVTSRYLNLPIGLNAKMQVFTINVDGTQKREFPAQLADNSADYWVFIDVSEFKNKTITLTGAVSQAALDRICQANQIEGAATLYKEPGRPLFHFTAKRGWNNDVNGPIFYRGQYHLFWQAFPFGNSWDTGFMYWGQATSKDLVHWQELPAALMLDKLGSPWSGSSLIDHNNAGGWGKDALVLFYTAFDRVTHKQVQCIAYSTDNGITFTRFLGNPILDTNNEVGSQDTRDPHVFWYEPTKQFVMVLFEKDGMSIFNSIDLKAWARKSHLPGLHECPDLFELPVDGDASRKKWVLHGGSSAYYIGTFNGETFVPESPELHYAEGKNLHGDDTLYASQSFAEMPDGRRIQMAWGRIEEQGMPFNQMILFPTKFKLVTTPNGIRMQATPIAEITKLYGVQQTWKSLSVTELNRHLKDAGSAPLHIRIQLKTPSKSCSQDDIDILDNGQEIATIQTADSQDGKASLEILVDRSVAEIFINEGARYIVTELPSSNKKGLQLLSDTKPCDQIQVDRLEIDTMTSMWKP